MKEKKYRLFGSITYAVTAILCVLTIVVSYGFVSENLDGWHGFKSGHAIIFAVVCIFLIVGCILNSINIWINKINGIVYLMGVALFVLPILFHIVCTSLAGNVETDLQYLILRISEGFNNTYVYIFIMSLLGFLDLLYIKFFISK